MVEKIYKHQTITDAVIAKYGEEPRLIMKLREEEDNRVVYRVFWDNPDKPSTVVVAVWKDEDMNEIKFLQEAQYPRKGGVELGS